MFSFLRRLRAEERALLLAVVAVAAAVRGAIALAQESLVLYPDEYIYSALARSIAERGLPLLRGAWIDFPGLLVPALTSPFWLLSDVAASYRLALLSGAFVWSLAALPAYLIARHLGLGRAYRLGAAVLAVALPHGVYTQLYVSEPLAHTLFLTACWSALRVLDRPSWRRQLLFLGLYGLLVLSRAQFLYLLPALILVIPFYHWRSRRERWTALLRTYLPLVSAAIACAALALFFSGRLLGFYAQAFRWRYMEPLAFGKWLAYDFVVLDMSSGWVIVPAALLGCLAIAYRPRSEREWGFFLIFAANCAALFFQAGVYGVAGDRVTERYLFYLAPLYVVLFGLAAERGLLRRYPHYALLALFTLITIYFPLHELVFRGGKDHSALLYAYQRLELSLAFDSGRAIIALGSLLGLGAFLLAWKGRGHLLLPAAVGVSLVASLAAADYVRLVGAEAAKSDYRAISRSGLENVTLAVAGASSRYQYQGLLFWNRNITSLATLGATVADGFPTRALTISEEDGRLYLDGKPLRGPLALSTRSALLDLEATPLLDDKEVRLWGAAEGRDGHRARHYLQGLHREPFGYFLTRGSLLVLYPRSPTGAIDGRLILRLRAADPSDPTPTTLIISGEDRQRRVVLPIKGREKAIVVPIRGKGAWKAVFDAQPRSKADIFHGAVYFNGAFVVAELLGVEFVSSSGEEAGGSRILEP
jgi:hypothetical protein